MAKKRLNKKVALIGSVVFVFLVLAAIWVILYLSRDPEKFIRDGDSALLAKDYEKAERCYGKARSLAKTDSLRKEILFKAVDVHLETNRWRNVLGCWNEIISIDPKNVKARFGRLKYFYIMADSGVVQVWREVESQASEFMELVEEAGLLMEETAELDPFQVQEAKVGRERIGPYLYLLRGRATLEMTRLGGITDPDESIERAINDLGKVRKLEPNNIDACWYLAQAVITKGEILANRGILEEREKAADTALELLERAVGVAGDDPKAHINFLSMKLTLAQRIAEGRLREKIRSFEPDCLLLVQKFPSNARAHSALAEFYGQLGPRNLDKAIMAAEKAVSLDRENVAYAKNAANLYYRKFSIYGEKEEIYKAIEVAKNALALPDAQDKPGPRQLANRRNKILLYLFLANCYVEQVLEPCEVRTEAQKQKWLADAEQAVHEIEQLFGIGEALQVVKWRGMLDLAKGNRNIAVRKLYAAYEQLKASGRKDAQLSYALAKVFKDTSEVGAVTEFLASALGAGIDLTKPESRLDYAEFLLKLNMWTDAVSNIDVFEENFGPNERSRAVRIKAYIAARQFDEAEEELAKAEPDNLNTIKLNMEIVQAKIGQIQRAISQRQMRETSPVIFRGLPEDVESETADELAVRLESHNNTLAELLGKLLLIEPSAAGEHLVSTICNNYIAEGETTKARDLVNRFLGYFPDSVTALFYKQILSEPEPRKVSQQRRKEIEEQVLSNIAETGRRAMNLGVFYQRNNELEKAAAQFKKVLNSHLRDNDSVAPAKAGEEEMTDSQRLAADYLFGIALVTKDWELAERIAELARRENIDDCDGQFFAARVAMAKEQYEDALARLDECLRQSPVFCRGFMLRSSVNATLGNEHASIQDAQEATSLNPLDRGVAKVLANALYRRDQKLGDNVSPDQMIETRAALDRAVALNPRDLVLRSNYAEYISQTEPLRALAIRQSLQKTAPSMRNAVLLGRLAMRMAQAEPDVERKEALFAVAASSFEQARRTNPQDREMLLNYAEYYRVIGQDGKAEQLLMESKDHRLLWSHYFRSGKFEDAKEVLERLYQTEAKDSDVVRGLLLVAERTVDKEAVKKYSQELLLLEDSVDNGLIQIQTFLKVGLIKEAEYKLQSIKEKYPDEPRAMLLEAWLAMKQRQLKKALSLTNQSLESDRDNAVAWRLRGEINLLMVNYDEAILDLKRSKLLSDEPVTRIFLARAYRQAGRFEEAITELRSTIDHPQAPMEARELLERIYLQLGRKAAVKRFYDETIRKFPDHLFWYNRAGAFALAESDFSRAEQLYGQAWQKSRKDGKGDVDAFGGYLQALMLGGKLDRVFEEAQEYVDSAFAPIAFFRMAEAKLKMGDKAVAIEYCRKALKKAETNEALASWVLRGMQPLLGAEEALRSCEERLKANPDSLAANYTMFTLAKTNGQYNKAVGYIDKCLEIVGPVDTRRFDYIVEKAVVLQLAYAKTSDKNYLKKAIAEYESLLAKMPNNILIIGVLNNLAYMLAESNERLSEALEYAERVYKTRPNNPGFLDTYAYVLYKNGRYLKAAEFLQAALQQYERYEIPVPPEVYEHLGMTKEKLGAGGEALAAYKKALEIGADELSKVTKERIKTAIERLSR